LEVELSMNKPPCVVVVVVVVVRGGATRIPIPLLQPARTAAFSFMIKPAVVVVVVVVVAKWR